MKRQLAAAIMTVVLCLSVFGAAFCMAEHAHHDCTGAGCSVCAVLEQCENCLRTAALAAAASLLLTVFCKFAAASAAPAVCEAAALTPIQLKVRLLN